MTFSYYLVDGRGKNLYARLQEGKDRVTFSLKTDIGPQNWDTKSDLPTKESGYLKSALQLQHYIEKRNRQLAVNVNLTGKKRLEQLKQEADSILADRLLSDITRWAFEQENKDVAVPTFEEHVKAAAQFLNLKPGLIDAIPYNHQINFSHPDYNGLAGELFDNQYRLTTAAGHRLFTEKLLVDPDYSVEQIGFWLDSTAIKAVYDQVEYTTLDFISTLFKDYQDSYSNPSSLREAQQWEAIRRTEWETILLFTQLSQQYHPVDVADKLDRDAYIGYLAQELHKQFKDSFVDMYINAVFDVGNWQKISLRPNGTPIFYVQKADS